MSHRSSLPRSLALAALGTVVAAPAGNARGGDDGKDPKAPQEASQAVIDAFSKGIEASPADPTLRRRRAELRALAGDVAGTVADLKKAEELDPKAFPLDVALWRAAVETSRARGGSKAPDLGLIQAEVAELRARKFKTDVASALQSPEDFGKMVEKELDKEMPKATRADVESGLSRLGLLDPSVDLVKETSEALMSQAAAYYDPEKKKFFHLMSDMPTALVEAVAAHELVHALQDQSHDLKAWMATATAGARAEGAPRNDDLELAARCVVEGEATFVQTVWQVEHMFHIPRAQALSAARMSLPMVAAMDPSQLIAMSKQALSQFPPDSAIAKSIAAADAIQPYILVPLVTAYVAGANFIQSVQSAGGWDAVDALYKSPPMSSEQCLHPEKYAKKLDRPTPLTLPDLPEIAGGGRRVADSAIHGELYLRVLLMREGVSSKVARTATAGWDGDTYRAWRDADGRTSIVLATTWDTPEDAREFFDAYRAALSKKYPALAAEKGESGEAFRFACGEPALGTGVLSLRGSEVFAVEGLPAELRDKVLAKLTAWKIEHVD